MKKVISLLTVSIICFSLISSQAVSANTNLRPAKGIEINGGPVIDDGRGGDAKLTYQTSYTKYVKGMSASVIAGGASGIAAKEMKKRGVPDRLVKAATATIYGLINTMSWQPHTAEYIIYEWTQPNGNRYIQTIAYFYDGNGRYLGSRVTSTDLYY